MEGAGPGERWERRPRRAGGVGTGRLAGWRSRAGRGRCGLGCLDAEGALVRSARARGAERGLPRIALNPS